MDPAAVVVPKTFNKKPIIIGGIILAVAAVVIGLLFLLQRNGIVKNSTSPFILQITSPILSISGKIEKISGNTLTISYFDRDPSLPSIPNVPGASPNPTPRTLNFQVVVSNKTIIRNEKDISAPPASPSATPVTGLALQDLKVGQIVRIISKEDLRTLSSLNFEATTITILPEAVLPKKDSSPIPPSKLPQPTIPPAANLSR